MFDTFNPKLLRKPFLLHWDADSMKASIKKARAKIVEWRFANNDMAHFEPFRKELFDDDPKWRKKGAKGRATDFKHGMDADGNIHVVMHKNRVEAHLVYHGNCVDKYEGGPLLRRYTLQDGQLRTSHILSPWHGAENHYCWKKSKLEQVVQMSWGQAFNMDKARKWTKPQTKALIVQKYLYDKNGLYEIANHYVNKDGRPEKDFDPDIQYIRIPIGLSLNQLSRDVEHELIQQVLTQVKAVKKRGPYYCLLLCYCAEDREAGWPPFILLGSDRERQRIVNSEESVKYYLWAPDEMREKKPNVEIPLKAEKLNQMCDMHSRLMNAKYNWSSPKRIFRNVSNYLTSHDWSKHIDTTDDFFVAAVDNTGEIEPADDIKLYAPKQFKLLRKKGLI